MVSLLRLKQPFFKEKKVKNQVNKCYFNSGDPNSAYMISNQEELTRVWIKRN